MKKKSKSFWSNPWTIAIGSGFVLSLISVGIDIFKKEKVFSTIGDVFCAVWGLIIKVINYQLKVWWVLTGIAILVLGVWIYSKYIDNKDKRQPKFLKYTEDFICGWLWAWRWEKTYSGLYDIEMLHPICNECRTPLVSENDYYGGWKCLRCGARYNTDMPPEKHIKMMIIDNVDKMNLCEYEEEKS